jgi:penicillin-binding protein 1C
MSEMQRKKAGFLILGRRRYRRVIGLLALFFFLLYWFSLPRNLFEKPLSVVLEDRKGRLLGARIAADGQWRFPPVDTTPDKFAQAIICFEDKRFWSHPGFDWRALGRAMRQNLRAGRIVSGGSTLSMQVMRLARGNRPRTVYHKFIELVLATRLEWRYSKEQILSLYASHAPFGGNVVGLEAASWRYFGKSPALLTWAEAATLAVLPNSPALIHPGRNREALLAKRNRLLDRLCRFGQIDSLSLVLAQSEDLPEQPFPLPRLAPHLLDRVALGRQLDKEARVGTTLDAALQQQATTVVERHHHLLRRNEIHNLAALVMHIPTGEVLAYVGNAPGAGREHGEAVDVIPAPRSTGSILKPLLYTLMLQEGELLPAQLVPDIPTVIGGYQPENFHQEYDGAVSARRALIRSLNVPMVLMLRDYGVDKFHYELRKLGFSYIDQPPDHYGLSLILGGAEASLWQITNVYAAMSRTLGHFYELDGRYWPADFRSGHYLQSSTAPEEPDRAGAVREAPFLHAGASWLTFEAMRELERPGSQGNWEIFRSGRPIAWKTGTSFGFRDAWAVGVDAEYAVGVWVGNADGEGRPGLVGVQAAAPVLFDLFGLLPSGGWFDPPYDDLRRMTVCRQSGFRPLPICPVDTIWTASAAEKAPACPYHQWIQLDPSGQWRVDARCAGPGEMERRVWFTLPPVMEYYYKSKDPNYVALPAFRQDCAGSVEEDGAGGMQMLYPTTASAFYLPVDLNGELSEVVFQAAHRVPETTVYWHLDEAYLGQTRTFHELALKPAPGEHLLTLVDEFGRRLECRFTILERE